MRSKLEFMVEGANVVRYHSRPGIRQETDGHHSHEVAMLCLILTGAPYTMPSVNLLAAALCHDLGEQKASDVSAPAKRALDIGEQLHEFELEALRTYNFDTEDYLTAVEARVLKMADNFSGMLYCVRELTLGNRNVLLMWGRWCSYINNGFGALTPLEQEVYESIVEMMKQAASEQGPNYDVFTATS